MKSIITSIILSICCIFSALAHDCGVAHSLALSRKANISNLTYNLYFDIAEDASQPIVGNIEVAFQLAQKQEIVLDFREDANKIHLVKVNGKQCQYSFENEHIIIPQPLAKKGKNKIYIEFTAGSQSLNRNPEYIYTLFVPDRARTAFPCFDQPDLKASFSLTLNVPEAWTAVSNSPIKSSKSAKGKNIIKFAPTEPLSTYIFAFTAGKFNKIEYPDGDRTICAYYRETDPERIRQFNDIFKQVTYSLHWLEDYTGIKYPFSKYDLVILPGFQYGGMEHTGATFYNDRTIFLTENPTPDEELNRAQLIAHETAHMWFGDLVTMRWFNDVWTKEVFANYFAAEITAPQFPDINHDLNWCKTYVAAAMSEDRSLGGTAIQQPLDNLNKAGLIYNQIIYNKAPVMMRKLVELIGKDAFQKGISEYLTTYSYSNASWADLVDILARHTDKDIHAFSDVWVTKNGMPTISLNIQDGKFTASQSDPKGRSLAWNQTFNVKVYSQNEEKDLAITFAPGCTSFSAALGDGDWHIVPNIDGKGYGFFTTTDAELNHWLSSWQNQEGASRQATLMALRENWLNKKINTKDWLNALFSGIENESDPLTASTLVAYCEDPIWELDSAARVDAENKILDLYSSVSMTSLRLQLYRLLVRVASSEDALGEIHYAWSTKRRSFLSDMDYIDISYQLMRAMPEQSDVIFMIQRERIKNPDVVRQYDFISRAVINNDECLDSLFLSLLKPENRRIEPWTRSVIALLNHPSRQEKAVKYIRPALDALQDVQRTGDIFFPAHWCTALLSSHRSSEAYLEVKRFLDENPDYPQLLKNKILNAAHLLFRANE